MDIGLLIGLMIVVYVIPEVLKRLKRKKPYEYPQFPEPAPQQAPEQHRTGVPGNLSQGMKPPPVPVYFVSDEGMAGDEGDPAWGQRPGGSVVLELTDIGSDTGTGLQLDPGGSALGFVWAEVLAPPLSLRSSRRSLRRC